MKKICFTRFNNEIKIDDDYKNCVIELKVDCTQKSVLCFEIIDKNLVDHLYFSILITDYAFKLVNEVYIDTFDDEEKSEYEKQQIILELKNDKLIGNLQSSYNNGKHKIILLKDFFISKISFENSYINVYKYELINNDLVFVDEIIEFNGFVSPQDLLFT